MEIRSGGIGRCIPSTQSQLVTYGCSSCQIMKSPVRTNGESRRLVQRSVDRTDFAYATKIFRIETGHDRSLCLRRPSGVADFLFGIWTPTTSLYAAVLKNASPPL